ncbi:hypothetical protein Tco_1024694, partial [Tanacetum coccineum]
VQENIGTKGEHTTDEQHNDDEFANSGLHSIGDVPLESLNQAADESPYDTKSEIKFMKRFKPLHADDEPQITFIGSEKPDEEEDSNMESLPDDDVGSMSGSQSSEKELSKSEKRDADELIDEMTELNASADKPSDPLSLLQSLFIKVDQLEPNITKKVLKELQTSVPSSVSTALKETLHVLLADALKDALPRGARKGKLLKNPILKLNVSSVEFIIPDDENQEDSANKDQYQMTPCHSLPSEEKTQPPSRDSTPPKEDRKGKGIATEEEPLKKLLPLLEQGRSDPKMLTLQQFSIAGKKMNLKEAEAQLNHLKRLANPKDAEEKSLKSLEKINIQAQAQKLAKYEAKRDKMLAEYNHYLTYRADPRKITKINYTIDRVTKDATMKIIKDNQPLSLKVMNKFGLKQLGFSEWVEIHALESK